MRNNEDNCLVVLVFQLGLALTTTTKTQNTYNYDNNTQNHTAQHGTAPRRKLGGTSTLSRRCDESALHLFHLPKQAVECLRDDAFFLVFISTTSSAENDVKSSSTTTLSSNRRCVKQTLRRVRAQLVSRNQ